MSKLHLNRDRQNLGQFTPEDVAEGLASGRFHPSDLAWREGMDAWLPLSSFTDLPPVIPEVSGEPGTVREPLPSPPSAPLHPEWERRAEVGPIRAMLGTIRQVFTNPVTTFRGMTRTGGLQGPLIYCYVLGAVCALIGVLEAILWVKVVPHHLLPTEYGDDPVRTLAGEFMVTVPLTLVMGFVIPFALSGIYYLMVKLLTKKIVAYETIFRAYCYTVGTLAILNLVQVPPIQGAQVAYLIFVVAMAMVYQIIAVREAAELTSLEAAGVVLLPLLLFCFCCIAIVGAGIAMVGLGPVLQQMGH